LHKPGQGNSKLCIEESNALPTFLFSDRQRQDGFDIFASGNIGGPVAQTTMMFNHMVEKRRWLSRSLRQDHGFPAICVPGF
jgi:hypothetical protein